MTSPIVRRGVSIEPNPILRALTTSFAPPETVNRRGRLHSSQVGMCARSGTLSALEIYSPQQSISTAYYMRMGTAVHTVARDAFEGAGLLVASEAKIPPTPFNLGGYIDAVVRVGDQISIVEVKTCGKVPSVPHENHMAQVTLYAALTGLPFHIAYISRNVLGWNRLEIEVFDYEAPTTAPTSLFNAALAALGVKHVLAPSIPFTNDSQCKFCDHFSRCWERGSPVIVPDASPVFDAEMRARAAKIAERMMRPENVEYRRWQFLKELKVEGS